MKYKTIVIDDSSIQRLATSFLVQTNPKLEFVGSYASPYEGIKAIYDDKVDIVLLDVLMDDVDAFELMNSIEINAAIIMNSTWERFQETAKQYDVVDFLIKPIPRVSFTSAIDKAIKTISQDAA